jgi:2-haloacid dehalogenase
METGERECSYLDRSGRYIQFRKMFKPLFYRMLWMAGIQEPRKFATDEDAQYLVEAYFNKLNPRPGIHECWQKLRDAGFTIWALTSGDAARVQGYLASGGIHLPDENFITCDTIGVSKPAPEVYKYVLDKFDKSGQTWFAA